jgi:phospholipid/cholesterol/gamma-HCH transport system substrate-binding protein
VKVSRSTILRVGVTVVVVALVAAVVGIALPGTPKRRLTAYFTSTVGLYPGADVRILGIRVGKVDKITPVGRSVRVEMTYDAKRKVPADVQAVIVNQSLVADRYVQLAPVYRGGAVLADNTTLPLSRTVTPVEIDDIAGSLNNLNKALGPNGANANGSLSRLLQVGSDTLNGQGDDIRATLGGSAKALSTLSEDRKDITANIENLRLITQALAVNDRQVRDFNGHLSAVSTQLAGEKEELGAALRALGPTLRNLAGFVKGNRSRLAANVRQLAQITSVLVKERNKLGQFLTTAPVGIGNLSHAYDPISATLNTRADLRQFDNLAMWVCSLAYSLGTPPEQCEALLAPINPVGKGLDLLQGDLSWITALTTTYNPIPPPPDAFGPNGPPASGQSGQSGKSSSGQSGQSGGRRSGPGSGTGSGNGIGALLPGGNP